MAKTWISILIVLLAIARVKGNTDIDLEAENGSEIFRGTVMDRNRASNQKTVRLTDGGYAVNAFETDSTCLVFVSNVAYTNDGNSDNVTVSIDDKHIGSFETVVVNNVGDYWDFVQNSASLGREQFQPGSHRLRLEVDGLGVEIDKSTLTLVCDGDNPSSDEVDDGDVVLGLGAGQVAGIAVGVATVIVGIIGFIIACYTRCCGACKHDYDL